MPEPLADALAGLRPALLDVAHLVRAVAAGHRRSARPAFERVTLRPVDLKPGRLLQVVTFDGVHPVTRNHRPGAEAEAAVDALLAEPFGNWHLETLDRVVQVRVTKRGQAQVHSGATSRRAIGPAVHDRVRQRLLDPADPLFAALGAGADKRRQVDAFLRLLEPAVAGAAQAAAAAGRPLRVVDLGCGNAYLTMAAHRWLGQAGVGRVETVGVDVRPDLVRRTQDLAAELGLTGLSFLPGAIVSVELGQPPVDVVLALHACDTATDEALARAVRWRAPVILAAPCCHHDLQRQLGGGEAPFPYGALTRHPILRERFADVLTDAARADLLRLLGYRVDVVEFVDSRHTPRNALAGRCRRAGWRSIATWSGPGRYIPPWRGCSGPNWNPCSPWSRSPARRLDEVVR